MWLSCFNLRRELCAAHLYILCHLQPLLETFGEVKVSDEKLDTVFLYLNLDCIKCQLSVCDIIRVQLFQSFCYLLDQENNLDFWHLRAPRATHVLKQCACVLLHN